jgi:hypothetical protein
MDGLLKMGRFFFAIAMAFFGVQYFIYASSMKGPIPGPPWIPGAHWLAWLTGFGFVAIAVGIAIEKHARLVAMLLGAALFLNILFLHLPGLITQIHNPGPWTVTFELLALCGASSGERHVAGRVNIINKQDWSITSHSWPLRLCDLAGHLWNTALYLCTLHCVADSIMDSIALVLGVLHRCSFRWHSAGHYCEGASKTSNRTPGNDVYPLGTCSAHPSSRGLTAQWKRSYKPVHSVGDERCKFFSCIQSHA